ncbi:uncharacterized protein OCT59_011284 [Rhizophagus irregularis]|uniref:uncharacterized protein n=1 Tax=Rhizophagus irregularis TaxID=588596 RepID=UPI001DF6A41E|nr:hypothetical protein OCT59_011284 [Rhizophagus irregularis]CAG8474325.1 12804_t:CDS:2 [Rhizophagus irregularis]
METINDKSDAKIQQSTYKKRKYDEINEDNDILIREKKLFNYHINKKLKSNHYREPYHGFLNDEIRIQMKFVPNYRCNFNLDLSSRYKISPSIDIITLMDF